MTPTTPTAAPGVSVEVQITKLLALITDFAIEAGPWLESEEATPSDRKAYFDGLAKVTAALRAALARPQEVAEDDLRSLKEADAMLADIGALLSNQTQFTGSYTEIVKQLLAASRAPVAVGVEPTRWHELKTDPEPFDAVMRGEKTCEIRRNDRDFKVGDGLLLRRTKFTGNQMHMRPEACPLEYTGEECRRVVAHISTGYGLENNCVLSFATPSAGAGGSVGAEPTDAHKALILKSLMKLVMRACSEFQDYTQLRYNYTSGEALKARKAYRATLDEIEGGMRLLATPAPSVPLGGLLDDWGVDTSAGRPVLVHKNCSVIESEEAFYVLHLIAADRARADVIQAQDAAPVGPTVEDQLKRLAILNAFMVELDSRLRMGESHGDGKVSTKMLRDLLDNLFKAAPVGEAAEQRANLDRYLKANYPKAKGNSVTARAIFALEEMDVALGMKDVEAGNFTTEAAGVQGDAARRYEFLRQDAGISDGRPFIAISEAGAISQWTDVFADQKIDVAIASQAGGKGA